MATQNDVLRFAFARLGMGIGGDPGDKALIDHAVASYAAIWDECANEAVMPWARDFMDEAAAAAFGAMLAAELAPVVGAQVATSRAAAKLRILGLARPDTRQDKQDQQAEYY